MLHDRRGAVAEIVRLGGVVVWFGLAACSSDLFHSTTWPNRCDGDSERQGCSTSQGGESSSPASASSSGGAGGAGGSGGIGQGGGMGAAGGAGGAGGSGGSAPCETCFQTLLSDDPDVPLCPGSKPEADALIACGCTNCALRCQTTCSSMDPPDAACQDCATANCANELQACQVDDGT
jgi:hypothetical protein